MSGAEGEAEEDDDKRRLRKPSRRELQEWWQRGRDHVPWAMDLLGLWLDWDNKTVALAAITTKATVWCVDRLLRH